MREHDIFYGPQRRLDGSSRQVSAPFNGVTVADVELMAIMLELPATQSTIRSWLKRGNITRSRDGLIDPESVINWLQVGRNARMIRTTAVA